MFTICIKSGTCGYFDHDGCDMEVAEINSSNIPRKDDVLVIYENGKSKRLLVTEVEYTYTERKNEWITVYVIYI